MHKKIALLIAGAMLAIASAAFAVEGPTEDRADALVLVGITGENYTADSSVGDLVGKTSGSIEAGARVGAWVATFGVGVEIADVTDLDFENPARSFYGMASAGLSTGFVLNSRAAIVAAVETPYFRGDRGQVNVGIGGLLFARRLVLGATYWPKADHRATVRLGFAF